MLQDDVISGLFPTEAPLCNRFWVCYVFVCMHSRAVGGEVVSTNTHGCFHSLLSADCVQGAQEQALLFPLWGELSHRLTLGPVIISDLVLGDPTYTDLWGRGNRQGQVPTWLSL